MTTPGNNKLFRQASLERLASPEKLDQMMDVVTLKNWIPLGTLGVMIGAMIVWSVVGRIPVQVSGRAAFVDPKVTLGAEAQIVDFQAPGTGILTSLHVNRGDEVKRGQVLGLIDQPELREQLMQAKERLSELQKRRKDLHGVQTERDSLDQSAITQQRDGLRRALEKLQALAPVTHRKNLEAIAGQRKATIERLAHARELTVALKQSLDAKTALREKGLIPDSAFLAAQRDYLGVLEQVGDLDGQLRELEARAMEQERAYLSVQGQIADQTTQLKALEVRARTLELDDMSNHVASSGDINEARRRVQALEVQIKAESEVRAEANGHVLEITGLLGQMVSRGTRLGSLNAENDTPETARDLAGVAYFTIGDGMRVQPGMRVQVTPDTVKREEYGGLVGTVKRVSAYPVSTAGVLNIVNNEVVARELTDGDHTIEVFMEFERDPATTSGYRWSSSRGPALPLTRGTTAMAQVMVESRAPITYVLPILKNTLGVQ